MVAAADIHNERDLAAWLSANNIDTSGWGSGGAKRMVDLWQEIQSGESQLTDDPPRRAVSVVQVNLRRDGAILLELAQQLRDGQTRERTRPPSEKLKAGEQARAAALRCLLEELGLEADSVEQLTLADEPTAVEADSPSYPGLATGFTIIAAGVEAAGLPDEDFWRDNVGAGESDPVVRHLWGWR